MAHGKGTARDDAQRPGPVVSRGSYPERLHFVQPDFFGPVVQSAGLFPPVAPPDPDEPMCLGDVPGYYYMRGRLRHGIQKDGGLMMQIKKLKEPSCLILKKGEAFREILNPLGGFMYLGQ